MSERLQNALIGLFVLGGLGALGVLIIQFGEKPSMFGEAYLIEARFAQVSNLREGSPVHLAGIQVGTVGQVDLVDPHNPAKGVKAVLEIRTRFRVPEGSIAKIEPPLIGQPAINIEPPAGGGPPLATDGSGKIEGKMSNPLERVLPPELLNTVTATTGQLGELAKSLTPAAQAITNLLEQRTIAQVDSSQGQAEQLTANLYTTVERLHRVLTHFDTVLGDPASQSNIAVTLENLRLASEEARLAVTNFHTFSEQVNVLATNADGVVVKLDGTVDTLNVQIDALGRSLLANSDRLARLLDYAVSAGRDLAEGNGTMGLLLRDGRFYEELLLTVRRLGSAAQEMQVFVKQLQEKGLLGSR